MKDEYSTMNSDGDTAYIDELELDCGRVLRKLECRYMTWGEPNAKRDNFLVVCHALTGNANLESWWKELLGPGKAYDTSKYCVFCSNVLGGCYGTTGPSSIDPATGKKYGNDFPVVTIRDMVRLQVAALEKLGVKELACVVGGSMGGMQALEWALCQNKIKVRSLISIASNGRHSPWQIGISECQRQAVYADPKWNGGNYDTANPPNSGLAIARMMAMISYRSDSAYKEKFGRKVVPVDFGKQAFDVENYLVQQGQKFLNRNFEPWTYIRLTQAMDTHDVEKGRGDYLKVLQSVNIPSLIISISSDVLYPVGDQVELAENIRGSEYHILKSDEGHDGFILETTKIGMLIQGFLGERRMVEDGNNDVPPVRSKL